MMRTGEEWLTIMPDSGSVPINQFENVTLICNPAELNDKIKIIAEKLNEDTYYTDLHIYTNDPYQADIAIPIKLKILPNNVEPNHVVNLPLEFILEQNYPNPFNPVTQIGFSLPAKEHVKLTIYDLLGKEISTPISQSLNPGPHLYLFDGSILPSGIYIYRLEAGQWHDAKKMILVK